MKLAALPRVVATGRWFLLIELMGIALVAYVCTRVSFGTAFFLLFLIRYNRYIEKWVEKEGQIKIGRLTIEKNRGIKMLLGFIIMIGLCLLYFILTWIDDILHL